MIAGSQTWWHITIKILSKQETLWSIDCALLKTWVVMGLYHGDIYIYMGNIWIWIRKPTTLRFQWSGFEFFQPKDRWFLQISPQKQWEFYPIYSKRGTVVHGPILVSYSSQAIWPHSFWVVKIQRKVASAHKHWANSAKNNWKSSLTVWVCLFKIVPVHKNCLYQKQTWQ